MIFIPLTAILIATWALASPISSILGVSAGDSFESAARRLEAISAPLSQKLDVDDDQAAFNLRGTPFKSVVVHASRKKVCWISAFVRNPDGIPFSEFGSLATGKSTDTLATWEVRSSAQPYRVLVQGAKGRARVVTLFAPSLLSRKY